jgi:DNA-directed RNA polymerase
MPNLVHSLDAASLSLLIDNFIKVDKNRNFYSIHDCFAVTCNNVNLIYELLKLSYYNIYCTQNFLINFDNKFKELIITQFGKDSYSEETRTFSIIREDGNVLKFEYPNINEVIKSTPFEFSDSSYFIG